MSSEIQVSQIPNEELITTFFASSWDDGERPLLTEIERRLHLAYKTYDYKAAQFATALCRFQIANPRYLPFDVPKRIRLATEGRLF